MYRISIGDRIYDAPPRARGEVNAPPGKVKVTAHHYIEELLLAVIPGVGIGFLEVSKLCPCGAHEGTLTVK